MYLRTRLPPVLNSNASLRATLNQGSFQRQHNHHTLEHNPSTFVRNTTVRNTTCISIIPSTKNPTYTCSDRPQALTKLEHRDTVASAEIQVLQQQWKGTAIGKNRFTYLKTHSDANSEACQHGLILLEGAVVVAPPITC